jgi:tricorn protease
MQRSIMRCGRPALALFIFSFAVWSPFPTLAADSSQPRRGYYTYPAVRVDAVVFTSEGDLWSVSIHGGAARRLTSSPGTESFSVISGDGKTVAFSANFEGPTEVYTMPLEGGLPRRRTWDGNAGPAGFAPDGRLIVSTSRYSTLPGPQLVLIDDAGAREILPLSQAAEGAYSPDGTLFFTRWPRQWSETKRYKGGWAENIWRFDGKGEAICLTADWNGTSTQPMFWNGRVYFLSDRDGVMNVFSMDADGHNVKQESHQRVFDVTSAAIDNGHIVYASGADLWMLDLQSDHEEVIPITLTSDFDQMREHWVKKPTDYLTDAHISPDGSSVVFTARGEIFTLPAKSGRTVKVAGNSDVRYRRARFMPDGKSIEAVSTQSGETEFWKYPANGEGSPEKWTSDGHVLRRDGIPSPDGNWLAHYDKDQQLWLYDIKKSLATSLTSVRITVCCASSVPRS